MNEEHDKELPGNIYGYCRASTSRQVESPIVQQNIIKDYVAFMKMGEVKAWFIDPHISGKTAIRDREAGKAMLDRLRKGDHVIVAKLDRAFRKLKDAVFVMDEFQRVGIKLHVCNLMGGAIDLSSPMGRFLVQIIAAFAELERNFTSERIRDGMKSSKALGRTFTGNPKMGFHYVTEIDRKTGEKKRVLESCEGERKIMRQIAAWRFQEPPFTFEEISRHLNKMRAKVRKSNYWNPSRAQKFFFAELNIRAEEDQAQAVNGRKK